MEPEISCSWKSESWEESEQMLLALSCLIWDASGFISWSLKLVNLLSGGGAENLGSKFGSSHEWSSSSPEELLDFPYFRSGIMFQEVSTSMETVTEKKYK